MKMRHLTVASFFVILLLVGVALGGKAASLPAEAVVPAAAPVPALVQPTPAADNAFRGSPVMFIENAGQWPEAARFQVRGGPAGMMWLAVDAIWITVAGRGEASPDEPVPFEADVSGMPRPNAPDQPRANMGGENVQRKGVNIKISFLGANPHLRIEPIRRLDTKISYFLGADPAKWRPGVPVWGGVRYVDLYPGVDLVVGASGADHGAVHPFWALQARAHTDAAALTDRVQIQVEGAEGVTAEASQLLLTSEVGKARLPLLAANFAYIVNGMPVDGRTIGQKLSPVRADGHPNMPADNPASLVYSTFLGGSSIEAAFAVAVDDAGRAYVAGSTCSRDFPITPGAFDSSHNGGCDDNFVARFNAGGSSLEYATLFGGSGEDFAFALALDAAGRAYVAGRTASGDFPTTPGAFDSSHGGGEVDDGFVVRLNADGSAMDYATFLGGSNYDDVKTVAVDDAGRAYVAGSTASGDFPTTPGAFDTNLNSGGSDNFVVRFNASGSSLEYATMLGGSEDELSPSIAIDGAGSAYVAGGTASSDFPTTPGAFDRSFNGDVLRDAFVVKLNPEGSGLTYATLLGGSGDDSSLGIAVDGAGSAFVTGGTHSDNFPTTPGAFDTSYNGITYYGEAFAVKLNPTGSELTYATFLGGGRVDYGIGIAVDSAGSAYVAGNTESSDFPATPDAFDISHSDGEWDDAFVAKLNSDASDLTYATFLGGIWFEWCRDVVVDREGNAYVTGWTDSSDFPTTPGAFDPSYNSIDDAYVVKLVVGPPLPFDAAGLASQVGYPTVSAGVPVDLWINVRNTGTTTWRACDGYGWGGDDEWQGQSGPVTGETPPGGIWHRETTLTAPLAPGEYVYGFRMRHGTQEFGPYFFWRVTVIPSAEKRVYLPRMTR